MEPCPSEQSQITDMRVQNKQPMRTVLIILF